MNPKVDIESVSVMVHRQHTFPESYDPTSRLTPPVNQGSCGSCWAIAAVQVAEDRLRLKGRKPPRLSYQHVNDCAENCVRYNGRDGCSNDCSGGFLTSAFEFMRAKGVLSAEAYKGKFDKVHGSAHLSAKVRSKCTLPPGADKLPRWRIDGYYHVMLYPHLFGIPNAREIYPPLNDKEALANTKNIMQEIHRHGPVASCMNMYSDFPEFTLRDRGDEVYELGWKTPGLEIDPVGDVSWSRARPGPGGVYFVTGHAVGIVGWGTSRKGVPYWIIRNSWGKQGGFVKFRRGVNASAIESDIEAPRVGLVENLRRSESKPWWRRMW